MTLLPAWRRTRAQHTRALAGSLSRRACSTATEHVIAHRPMGTQV